MHLSIRQRTAATTVAVNAAGSPAEREMSRYAWERRGILGRLVRSSAPSAGRPS